MSDIFYLKKIINLFAVFDFYTTFALAISNGALVQLDRIRACHARGQGFESPTHRERNDINDCHSGVYIVFLFITTQVFTLYPQKIISHRHILMPTSALRGLHYSLHKSEKRNILEKKKQLHFTVTA